MAEGDQMPFSFGELGELLALMDKGYFGDCDGGSDRNGTRA